MDDYIIIYRGFKNSYKKIFLIFLVTIILIYQLKSRELKMFHNQVVSEIREVASILKQKFEQRCSDKTCKPGFNSCSDYLPDLQCMNKSIDGNCKKNKGTQKYLTIQLQNKYLGVNEITNKNFGFNKLKEIVCSLTNDEVYNKFEYLNNNFIEIDQFYVGSYLGSLSRSPGRQKCLNAKIRDLYNPTERPWFCYGATGLKKIIIIVDFSYDFFQKSSRVTNMKDIISLILSSLSYQDLVSIILFDDEIIPIIQNNKNYSEFNNYDIYLKQNVTDFINEKAKNVINKKSKDFSKPLRIAVDLIKNNEKKDGINSIFLITDGNAKENEIEQVYEFLNSYNFAIFNNLKPIFFLIGLPPFYSTQTSRDFLQNLSCKINGILFLDDDGSRILEKIKNYCIILSNKSMDSPQIVGPYYSFSQQVYLYSYTFPIFSKIENQDFLIYVLGLDFQMKYLDGDQVQNINFIKEQISSEKAAESFSLDFCQLEIIRQSEYTSNYSCKNNPYSKTNIFNYTTSQSCNFYFMKHHECNDIIPIKDNQEIFFTKINGNFIKIEEDIDKSRLCCDDDQNQNTYLILEIILPILFSIFIIITIIIIIKYCSLCKKKPKKLVNQKTDYKSLNKEITKNIKNDDELEQILKESKNSCSKIYSFIDNLISPITMENKTDLRDSFKFESIYESYEINCPGLINENKRMNRIVIIFIGLIDVKEINSKIEKIIKDNNEISKFDIYYFYESTYKEKIQDILKEDDSENIMDSIIKNMEQRKENEANINSYHNRMNSEEISLDFKYKDFNLSGYNSHFEKCFAIFCLMELEKNSKITLDKIIYKKNNDFCYFTNKIFFYSEDNTTNSEFTPKNIESEIMKNFYKSFISREIEIEHENIKFEIRPDFQQINAEKIQLIQEIRKNFIKEMLNVYLSIYKE